MSDVAPTVESAVEAVQAKMTPTTFNFAAAVNDREYPEISVPIYINEKAIQTLLEIFRERAEMELKVANLQEMGKTPAAGMAKKLNALNKRYEEVRESLKDQEYTIKIKGIAPEESGKLEELAYETFPREYEESINPVTGAVVKTEKENIKREEYFANIIRQAHLISITNHEGAVDEDWSDLNKVATTFKRLPLLARSKVDQAINESTITVDFYRELVDEVF